MSIEMCPYCGHTYDQDFDVEHEEVCRMELEDLEIKEENE